MSSWKASAVNPNETFLSQAEKTSYGSFLREHMKFTVYVHREGFQRNFHHRIVVASEKHGFVTLEMSMKNKRVVPVCEQFQGKVTELEWKKEVECTFEDLAEEAIRLLRNMGRYSLIHNNCQNFCIYFLEEMEAPQYMTTARQFAIGAGAVTVMLGAVLVLWTFLNGKFKNSLYYFIATSTSWIVWCIASLFCSCFINTCTFATMLSLSRNCSYTCVYCFL